jgi:hypothetical protein
MTIFGSHTIGELKDLLRAKDNIAKSLEAKWFELAPRWQAANKSAADDWQADFQAFKERYQKARNSAQLKIDTGRFIPFSDDLPADEEYEGIIRALTVKRNGTYEKGDIQDLYNRIAKINGAGFGIPTPQPQSVDRDLDYYKTSGTVLTALDQTADAAIERGQRAVAKSKLEDAIPYALAALAVGVAYSIYQKR